MRKAEDLAPGNTTLQEHIVRILLQPPRELQEDDLRVFETPSGGCPLLLKDKTKCSKTHNRADRRKHHIQEHLELKVYPCAGKAPAGLAWYVFLLILDRFSNQA